MRCLFALFACASASRFGPHNCVSLSKSATGSCVLQTDCVGIDTSKFEFTFDCETSPGERLRHSFGVGGFDEQEEFDTSIKCSKCIEPQQAVSAHEEKVKPSPVPVHMKAGVSTSQAPSTESERMDSRGVVEEQTPMHVHFLSSKTEQTKEEAAVKYGPGDCVSTWRDEKSGHCIVKTDCAGKDTTEYMFGLICEEGEWEGKTVDGKIRHLFGKDSFDSKETFDTLIPCKKCLALDNVTKATELEAENAELAKEVQALATEVGTVKKTYEGLQSDVKKLNTAVAEKEGGGEKKEEKKEETKEEAKSEEKKEGEKKEEDKKDGEEKKEEKPASFYLTDRDVDESLPLDSIVKSNLKGSSSEVKKRRGSNQKKQRQLHQKTREVEADSDDNDDDAEDEDAASQRNFRHASQKRTTAKEDNSDDSDDSSEDSNDD